MRVETVYCQYRYTAKEACPWASKIAKVESGQPGINAWKCFESVQDYETWKNQK